MFRKVSKEEEEQWKVIKECDRRREEARQKEYAEQREDPEWYALKMAARVEKERDSWRGGAIAR